jgi:transcriptional regulator with XRE-family HTH domain
MLATLYTAVPLPFEGMRKRLHNKDPQGTLGLNLTAAFEKRGLSARGVAKAIRGSQGLKISNKTVSNMLNGEGNPQLEGLKAVAKHVNIPLWQLLCPAIQISQFNDGDVHELLEEFFSLSEFGRKRALRNLKGEAALEQLERAENAQSAGESST